MSIKMMSMVWDQSRYDGSALLLHLALADHANDSGICWPSIKTLSRKVKRSPRQIMRLISAMEEDGTLVVERRHGTSNLYRVTMPNQWVVAEKVREVVTSTSPGSDIHDSKPVTPMSPDPSLPVKEPSASAPGGAEDLQKKKTISISKALRSTLTRGEDDPVPRSALAEYIGQQMNSPLSSGNLNKLSLGYTEQLPGGEQRKHPSPDVLWKTHPLYPTFVEERIEYWRGQSGSNAQKRIKVVNSICSYKGNHFSWLDWLSRHSTETTPTPQPDYEPEVPEYDVEELEEWAASIPIKGKTTTWSSEIEDDS